MTLYVKPLNEYKVELQGKVVDAQVWQTCINCQHWNPHQEECTLYQARPPARVITLGCPSWSPEVPF